MLEVLSRHRVFACYCGSLLWLTLASFCYALVSKQGVNHAPFVAAITLGSILAYVLFWRLLSKAAPQLTHWPAERGSPPGPCLRMQSTLLWALTLLILGIFIAHMVVLGHIPALAALASNDDYQISVIRQEAYFGVPVWMRYLSDYSFKALAPALLVISLYLRQRVFWVILLISALYTMTMFVRVLPLVLLLPLVAYLFLQRRWLGLLGAVALLALLISAATSVSAPSVRPDLAPTTPRASIGEHGGGGIANTLIYRALIVPGQVTDQWLSFYSRPDSLERGCGYRVLAKFLGCNYVHLPTKLYEFYYPENIARGMIGSLNSASFMIDYANFGNKGVAIGVLFVAMIFCLITCIFRDHPLALPLNLSLILASMETSFLTALNSGAGWLVMTALFLIFFRISKA